MKIARIIARAKRMGRIANDLVLCDVCDTPASKKYSMALSWTACGACAVGESDEVNPDDFIVVSKPIAKQQRTA